MLKHATLNHQFIHLILNLKGNKSMYRLDAKSLYGSRSKRHIYQSHSTKGGSDISTISFTTPGIEDNENFI